MHLGGQAHSAILKTSTGLKMYQQMDSDDVDDILPVNDLALRTSRCSAADEDGTMTFSSSLNTLSTYVSGMISDQILDDGWLRIRYQRYGIGLEFFT